MQLENRINEEMKEAMKSGDKTRLDTLRSIRAAILEFAKSGNGKELDDEEGSKILMNQAKKRKDAITMYEQASRPELAGKEKDELEIITEFLPKQMDESEIRPLVREIIAKTGAAGPSDLGKVMGPAMKELKGKADGNLIQAIVKNLLGMS